MILDRLENAAIYRPLGLRIAAALDYLQSTAFSMLAEGRHDLDGDDLFAIVARYRTKPVQDAVWEAHRRYIDVQCVVEGVERVGYASREAASRCITPYDPEKDVELFDVRGDLFELRAGQFAIFTPHDLHAPGLAAGLPAAVAEVFKVVVKCRVAGW